jgi:hypothetical protein
LEGDDERVNGDGFRQSHADDAQGENFSGGAGIASDGFDGFHADEANADGGTGTGDCEGETSAYSGGGFSEDLWDHGLFVSIGLFVLWWCSPPPADLCHGPGGEIFQVR